MSQFEVIIHIQEVIAVINFPLEALDLENKINRNLKALYLFSVVAIVIAILTWIVSLSKDMDAR